MPTTRDTYKYHFKVGRTVVHKGITYDLDRREIEHRNNPEHPEWSKGNIKQIGLRTTRDAALGWEREQEQKTSR